MPKAPAALLMLLGMLAMPAVSSAQAPGSLGSGRAPVPNVRAPLPQPEQPSAALAPVDNALRSGSSDATEIERRAPTAGAVGRVVNGDTLKVDGRTIRLWGIDAPELVQACERDGRSYACGHEAAAYLRTLLTSVTVAAALEVACAPRTNDRYGRPVALCRLGDMDLGAEMVRAGWALAFAQHGRDYAAQEDEARENRRGLWEGTFEAPWEWRARKLGE